MGKPQAHMGEIDPRNHQRPPSRLVNDVAKNVDEGAYLLHLAQSVRRIEMVLKGAAKNRDKFEPVWAQQVLKEHQLELKRVFGSMRKIVPWDHSVIDLHEPLNGRAVGGRFPKRSGKTLRGGGIDPFENRMPRPHQHHTVILAPLQGAIGPGVDSRVDPEVDVRGDHETRGGLADRVDRRSPDHRLDPFVQTFRIPLISRSRVGGGALGVRGVAVEDEVFFPMVFLVLEKADLRDLANLVGEEKPSLASAAL